MAEQIDQREPAAWLALFLAWVVALVSTLAALFIGEVMGQEPCNLCWFQRAFMFPLAVVLGVACLTSDRAAWRYATPLVGIGWLFAAYHMLLYAGIIRTPIVPCGAGPSCVSADMTIFGGVPLPALSLGAFSAIIVLLEIFRKRQIA